MAAEPEALFLLMTILSQTFFTLVRSHLVAFTFFSAGHCCVTLKGLMNVLVL